MVPGRSPTDWHSVRFAPLGSFAGLTYVLAKPSSAKSLAAHRIYGQTLPLCSDGETESAVDIAGQADASRGYLSLQHIVRRIGAEYAAARGGNLMGDARFRDAPSYLRVTTDMWAWSPIVWPPALFFGLPLLLNPCAPGSACG
jgi:hypothetical protein